MIGTEQKMYFQLTTSIFRLHANQYNFVRLYFCCVNWMGLFSSLSLETSELIAPTVLELFAVIVKRDTTCFRYKHHDQYKKYFIPSMLQQYHPIGGHSLHH